MKRRMVTIAVAAVLGAAGTALGQVEDDAANRERTKRIEIDRAGAPPVPQQIDVIVERALGVDAGGQVMHARVAGKKEKVTYLGVVTSAAQPAMREQLKLPRGVGLVVDVVEAKTAAEAAGVKQHDVIEKLNDQLIVNTEQLTALLRGMKAGDEVTLTVVRKGERQSIKVKLGEKEIDAGGGAAEMNGVNFIAPVPVPPTPAGAAQAWVFDRPVTANPGVMAADAGGGIVLLGAPPTLAGNVLVRQVDGKQTTDWADDQVRISVEREGDKTTKVTITDVKTGKLMMTGVPPAADDPFFKAQPELAAKLAKAMDAATARPMQFALADWVGQGPVAVGARGKVVQWQDADHVLVMRTMGAQPIYLLALSKKDGRTLYDGPVMTDEQRKGVPAEVAEQFEMVAGRPDLAKEFGAAEPKEKTKENEKK